uniref:hypothetical protein n=1 Tax=uncultured Rikenella sp. TaxID=368003 RepID=UPI00262A23A1
GGGGGGAALAPGCRNHYTGEGDGAGSHGFGYSSSVSGGDGLYLSFSGAHLNPCYANNRALGFQLRCLSE